MQKITPYLYYEDVAAALEWLAAAFGFRECGPKMTDPDGTVRHASMELDDALIMLGHPGPEYRNPNHLSAATQCLYVRVNDVNDHFERAKKAGAKILHEPQDMEYGDRRYGAEDLEGHQWYFAQSAE
jgi:uncharacterized glyoxalase superfamily protein PhnB